MNPGACEKDEERRVKPQRDVQEIQTPLISASASVPRDTDNNCLTHLEMGTAVGRKNRNDAVKITLHFIAGYQAAKQKNLEMDGLQQEKATAASTPFSREPRSEGCSEHRFTRSGQLETE
ncbi:unnamed protein product [Pleuronectes platessa]|uniref:Uncharacterized protein n=1 Tax=Pleuronectes platessa TaxID=8262 RepID=A0A9N7V3B6_PLEPL|nr:unnamed protein product [Pleuronectes platessa]